jgi:hypothetical protein
MKQKIGRWESKGKKYWIDLYEEEFNGKPSYYYKEDRGGGNLGHISKEEAFKKMEQKVQDAQLDGINFKKVLGQMKLGGSFVVAVDLTHKDRENLIKQIHSKFTSGAPGKDIHTLISSPFDGAAIIEIDWWAEKYGPGKYPGDTKPLKTIVYPDKAIGSAPEHVKSRLDLIIKELGINNKVKYQ